MPSPSGAKAVTPSASILLAVPARSHAMNADALRSHAHSLSRDALSWTSPELAERCQSSFPDSASKQETSPARSATPTNSAGAATVTGVSRSETCEAIRAESGSNKATDRESSSATQIPCRPPAIATGPLRGKRSVALTWLFPARASTARPRSRGRRTGFGQTELLQLGRRRMRWMEFDGFRNPLPRFCPPPRLAESHGAPNLGIQQQRRHSIVLVGQRVGDPDGDLRIRSQVECVALPQQHQLNDVTPWLSEHEAVAAPENRRTARD